MLEKIDQILLLLLQGKASERDKEYFQKWLREDIQNQKIYEALKVYWEQKPSNYQLKTHEMKQAIWSYRKSGLNKEGKHLYSWFAAALVAITVIGVIYMIKPIRFKNQVEQPVAVQWIEKSTVAGVKLKTVLPDGSTVNLNSDTKIRYPSSFNDSIRELQITGEAYFEVVHDEDKPFVVISKNIKTTVLGTSFIVSAYDDESTVRVALEKGRVKTELLLNPDHDVNHLVPGEYVEYNNKSLEKGLFNKNEVFGWKDGILVFQNDDFDTAIGKLKRWYGVEFIMEGNKPKWNLIGQYEDASLEGILETISYYEDFSYEFIDGKIIKIKL